MATAVTDCGNVRIITQVVQQPGAQSAEVAAARTLGSTSTVSQIRSPQIKKFKNMLPKALGGHSEVWVTALYALVVQIVLGATQISFGIVLTLAQGDFMTLTVRSGVYFWIGILLLFSGSLLVEMEKREHVWLMKASLFANMLVSVAALIATVLHVTEMTQETKAGNLCAAISSDTLHCDHDKMVLAYGLNSVFIIFSLLEIAIAVTASVIGFKASRQQLYQWMIL